MASRVVLITGASRGIGHATANLLANQGFTVYGTSRQPQRVTLGVGFELLLLDVNIADSVQMCVQRVVERGGRIDALINNAAYTFYGAVEETTVEEAKALFETNFFGVQRMINAVLPIMREQGSGQIINVSSMGGLLSAPFIGLYCAAKYALEGYSEALRHETKHLGIKVSTVQPGDISTQLSIVRTGRAIAAYDGLREQVCDLHDENVRNGPPPQFVAQTILRILNSPQPHLRYPIGPEARGLIVKRFMPQRVTEWMMRKVYKLP